MLTTKKKLHNYTGILIDLKSGIFSRDIKKEQKTIIHDNVKMFSLNVETQQYINETRCINSSRVVRNNDDNYNLAIYYYDNRKHHLINEMEYIAKAKTVIFLPLDDPITDNQWQHIL